jgi:hypothetical protein
MANAQMPTYNLAAFVPSIYWVRGPLGTGKCQRFSAPNVFFDEKSMPVIYDLQCDAGHRFEGWFKNAEEYVQQREGGLLACPRCACAQVHRLPTASHVGSTSSADAAKAAHEMVALKEKSDALLTKIHDFVERHFDDVGTAFAEEARKIHYGEAKERNIRGHATHIEVRALHEEGVDVLSLPAPVPDKSKLN